MEAGRLDVLAGGAQRLADRAVLGRGGRVSEMFGDAPQRAQAPSRRRGALCQFPELALVDAVADLALLTLR
jgi:hypothetical protein